MLTYIKLDYFAYLADLRVYRQNAEHNSEKFVSTMDILS